jgi:hypothetical protein
VPKSWSCDKLDDLQFLTVATNINHGAAQTWMLYKCYLSPQASSMELSRTQCCTSAHCRHEHQHGAAKKLYDLQVLAVAPSIKHGAANKLDALQLLTVATNNWMIYKCSLSHQASNMELRTNWMLYNC